MSSVPFFLLPKFMQDRIESCRKAEREARKKAFDKMKEDPIIWDDKTKFEKFMVVDTQSWYEHTREFWPFQDQYVVDRRVTTDWKRELETDIVIDVTKNPDYPDRMLYRHQLLPAGDFLEMRGSKYQKGEIAFTEDTVIPTIIRDRRFSWSVWMSFTPMEYMTLRAGTRFARGDVLVGGLGMGWQAKKIAAKKNVKKVTVVEKEKALIDVIGPTLPKTIEVVHGSVYDYLKKNSITKHDRVVLDIWPGIMDSRDDYKLHRLFREVTGLRERTWCWGGKPRGY